VCDRPVANDPPDALSINLSVRARTGNLEAATLKSISALSFIRSAPPVFAHVDEWGEGGESGALNRGAATAG